MVTRVIAGLMAGPLLAAACSTPVSPAGAQPTASVAVSISASPSPTGTQERSLTLDGRVRSYLLYVPLALDRSKQTPLVIFLHGSGEFAPDAERYTELSVQAERQRFVVVYPAAQVIGQSRTWNIGCCNDQFTEKVDDLGFVQQIIRRTAADLSIDPDRIYLTGFSAGAALAHRIACEAPETFAAIGAISGNLAISGCSPRADVSILEIHGTKDTQSLYGGCSPTTPCGNARLTSPPVEQTMARYRELFGCPAPSIEREGTVTKTAATPCRGGTEVTLITSEGGVHLSPLGSTTGGTMASADVPTVLKFVFAHRRPPAR